MYQIPYVLLIYFLLSNTIDIPLFVPRQFILLFPHKSKNYQENATNLEFKQNPRIPVDVRLIPREEDVYPVRGRILQFTGTRSPDTKVVRNKSFDYSKTTVGVDDRDPWNLIREFTILCYELALARLGKRRRDEEEVVNPGLERRDKNFRGQYSHAAVFPAPRPATTSLGNGRSKGKESDGGSFQQRQ